MTLPKNIIKNNINMETKSGLTKHALTEMEHSPREPKKLPNKARETEAVKVNSSNIHMNKSAEAHESLPPKESDQEYIVEEISLRHQLGSAPDVTDNANASEIGSGKVYLEDDYDPTMVARDENKNAENLPWFQVMTLERCVPIQEGYNQAVIIR